MCWSSSKPNDSFYNQLVFRLVVLLFPVLKEVSSSIASPSLPYLMGTVHVNYIFKYNLVFIVLYIHFFSSNYDHFFFGGAVTIILLISIILTWIWHGSKRRTRRQHVQLFTVMFRWWPWFLFCTFLFNILEYTYIYIYIYFGSK